MTRLAALVAAALLLAGCGMTVGLKPRTEVIASGPVEELAVQRGETLVAGVTLTTLADPNLGEATSPPGLDSGETGTPPPSGAIPPSGADQSTTTTPPPPDPSTSVADADTTTTTGAETTSTSAEPPELPDIGTVFDVDDDFITHDCAGGDVTISGDAGTYTLEGSCRAILLRGSFNTVFIDELGSIDLTGTLNAVVYAAGTPTVNDWGVDNIVTAG